MAADDLEAVEQRVSDVEQRVAAVEADVQSIVETAKEHVEAVVEGAEQRVAVVEVAAEEAAVAVEAVEGRVEIVEQRVEVVVHEFIARAKTEGPSACPQGHPFTPENSYINPSGSRQCRTCRRIRAARYYQGARHSIPGTRLIAP